MRNRIMFVPALLLLAAHGRGEPIRYEQIPADVVSYVHFDIERFFQSRIVQQGIDPAQLALAKEMLGNVTSCTIYFWQDGPLRAVALLHADAGVRAKVEARANQMKGKLIIKYDGQDVYSSTQGAFDPTLFGGTPEAFGVIKEPQSPPQKLMRESGNRNSLSLGVGSGNGIGDWVSGPSYQAFVGNELIVATTDLHSIATALDVLHAKKPSLANLDPRGLKAGASPGAILSAVGVTASIKGDNLDEKDGKSSTSTTKSIQAGAAFGFDLFGSYTGKAQIARLELGEDDQNEYVNASISMVDQETAEQLKNLIVGVKALVMLSQTSQAPLLAPLEIRAAEKNVILRWSWPAAKLNELKRLMESNARDGPPTSNPTSRSAR